MRVSLRSLPCIPLWPYNRGCLAGQNSKTPDMALPFHGCVAMVKLNGIRDLTHDHQRVRPRQLCLSPSRSRHWEVRSCWLVSDFQLLIVLFRRRPVFLLSSLLLVASSFWAAKSGTSFESHFAARLVQGIAGGATESLLPLILTDMSFLHERAYYFGCYWVVSHGLGSPSCQRSFANGNVPRRKASSLPS